MNSWFCYEMNFAGRWIPIVYNGEKPRTGENSFNVERSVFWVVPPDCLDEFGNPLFGKLQERFKIA